MQLLRILILLYGSGVTLLTFLSLGEYVFTETNWKDKLNLLAKRIFVVLLWPMGVFSRHGRHVLGEILKGGL